MKGLLNLLLSLIISVDSSSLIDGNILQEPINLQPQNAKSCRQFNHIQNTEDQKLTIYSPNYPNLYPDKLDCFHVIKSSPSNAIIKLEFRQIFDVEYSKNCTNDFLEIRDGPFGYSRLLRRLCGKNIYPNDIESSSGFLWLHFSSDIDLAGHGFQIVFSFRQFSFPISSIDNKICYKKITIPSGHAAIFESSYLVSKFRSIQNLDNLSECTFDFRVSTFNKIFLKELFLNRTNFNFYKQSIEFYDEYSVNLNNVDYENYFSLSDKSKRLFQRLFHSNRILVRIRFKSIKFRMYFKFIITSLRLANQTSGCAHNEFSCKKLFCLSNQLVCDKRINCPHGDDELCWRGKVKTKKELEELVYKQKKSEMKPSKRSKSNTNLSEMTSRDIIILGAISSILTLCFIVFIVHSSYENKRDHRVATSTRLIQNN